MKVAIIGASGKLGQYMVQHALDRGHEVVGVCREKSVSKLDGFDGITIVPPGSFTSRSSTIRSRPAAGSSRATPVGQSSVEVDSKRVRARASLYGAGTWETPSSKATSPAAWTSPCS